jgi:peptidoglycan/LPS O-acetylase OafA/YrhL
MTAATKTRAAFSLRDNLRALFEPRSDAVPAVTGFRGLSMCWVLIQHTLQGLRPYASDPAIATFLANPFFKIAWAGNLAIETFFVISGYLIGGMLMEEREKLGTIDFRSFYVRRALRILPAYLVAMSVNLVLPSVHRESIWANLTFINNFIPFQKQFMAHCWSLAIEEQFFAVAPVCILLLYNVRAELRPRLVGLSVALACIIAVRVAFDQHLELSMRFPNGVQFWRYMDEFYTKPYTRFGSLALGIFVATVERDGRWGAALERRPYLTTLLAGIAIAAMIYVMFVFPECRGPNKERLPFGVMSMALDGYVFGTAIAFFLLLSRTQHWFGRFLEAFLGMRILHVLAQLSFPMYLLHPVCITPLYGWLGVDAAHPWGSYLRILAGSFAVSMPVGAVIFLFVELPIMRLRPRRPVSIVK